jgi:hypothetical protein
MKTSFITRLILGLTHLLETPVIFFGWIWWIFTEKDITYKFLKYKENLTKEIFKDELDESKK